MESSSSQALATESFSYSWLVNQTPHFDDLEEHLTSSSHYNTNFNFDTSISASFIVHADEIFSNGHIMPLYTNTTNIRIETPSSPINSHTISPQTFVRDHDDRVVTYFYFFRKWRKSSTKIIRRCLRILWPRKSIRVDDIEAKRWELQNHYNNSHQALPRQNVKKKIEYKRLQKAKNWSNLIQESEPLSPYCSDSVSCEIENSIYEAVLHCKRSIGN